MTIEQFIRDAEQKLTSSGISTSRLDAEIIIAHVLGQNKAWLIAHAGDELTPENIKILGKYIERRNHHEPVAYIVGHKEFCGIDLRVNQNVLIPRPETEIIVEYATKRAKEKAQILELGTGSGAISIAIAQMRPDCAIIATDISDDALKVAKDNAAKNTITAIAFQNSNLLASIKSSKPIDMILANLPYVYSGMTWQKEIEFEPQLALDGGEDGLTLYRALFVQLKSFPMLTQDHELVVEYDTSQRSAFEKLAVEHGYSTKHISDFVTVCYRKIKNLLEKE